MSDFLIRQLFEQRLKTWAELNQLPLQLENQIFDAPNAPDQRDNAYLRAFLLKAATVSSDIEGIHRGYSGVFQIDIVTARGIGPAQAEGIADQLSGLFPNNLTLTHDSGFKVQIISPLRKRTGLPGDTTWTMPTDFAYRADTF